LTFKPLYTIYLIGGFKVREKQFEKCYFLLNLEVGDIHVDSFFNTNFTFSEFAGGKISDLTSKLSTDFA